MENRKSQGFRKFRVQGGVAPNFDRMWGTKVDKDKDKSHPFVLGSFQIHFIPDVVGLRMKELLFQEICSIRDAKCLEKEESHRSPFAIPTGCDSELKMKLLRGISIKSFEIF